MLMKLFQSMTDRLRTLFVADVALDFEAELIRRQAQRKERLLIQADDLQERGFRTVASDLRRQAEMLAVERPLAGVLPAMKELDVSRESEQAAIATSATPSAVSANGKRPNRKAG